jgi:betaine-homocysteine S-methyltransferase
MAAAGLLERLEQGHVVCGEGYLFELERRGYVQAGPFVPEVVLERPEAVLELHREFVHAGSDVVEAFTYYAHREKLRVIGREDDLEPLNRQALALAKEVADETGTLFAGDICNTNVYEPGDPESEREVRAMFEEQVGWAAEAGADFVIAETYSYAQEALLGLEAIKAAGLPAVVTIGLHQKPQTREGWTPEDACKRLADAGADVVGLNCHRGPRTTLPLLGPIVEAVGDAAYVAALPVPYRTTEEEPTFQSFTDPQAPGTMPFPTNLDPFHATRDEIAEFGREASALGVRYLGLCCGGAPHYLRALAEALGRTPPASRFSADMSKHAYFGEEARSDNRAYAAEL